MVCHIDRPLFFKNIKQVLFRYSIQIFSIDTFRRCFLSINPIHPTCVAAEFAVYIQISLFVPGVPHTHTFSDNTVNDRLKWQQLFAFVLSNWNTISWSLTPSVLFKFGNRLRTHLWCILCETSCKCLISFLISIVFFRLRHEYAYS